MGRRVVITGIGAITSLGNTIEETWQGIVEKKCGIDKITNFDAEGFKTSLAGELKGYDPLNYFDAKQARKLDKSSQIAIIASRAALKDSNMTKENTDFERVGSFISSGIAGINTIEKQCEIGTLKGYDKLSPLFIPMAIANMPAGNVAIDLGLKGESISILSACSSSAHAIGEAYKTIKYGAEDAILAGGAETAVCKLGIACFENMKALSPAKEISRASIPFDKERSGFVMGEGAGVVVLEDLEHALKRDAKIYAEIVGYGATCDAYHITCPAPEGEGGARAMKRAIQDAGIRPEEIDYINAHGTSTRLNDSLETSAIKTALGKASKKVMVSSTKSNIGHLLGAAGGVEIAICAEAIVHSIVPPTINYKVKDEECDLDIVPNELRKAELNYVMSNSFGFGGQNASIILKKYKGE